MIKQVEIDGVWLGIGGNTPWGRLNKYGKIKEIKVYDMEGIYGVDIFIVFEKAELRINGNNKILKEFT